MEFLKPDSNKKPYQTDPSIQINNKNNKKESQLTSITEAKFADTTSPESSLIGTNIQVQTNEQPISLKKEISRARQLDSTNFCHLADLKHQLDLYQKENRLVSFFEKLFDIGEFGQGYKQYDDIYDRLAPGHRQIVDKLVDSYSKDNIEVVGLHLPNEGPKDPEKIYNGFVKNGLPSGEGIILENLEKKSTKYSHGIFKEGKLEEGIITIQTDKYIRKIAIDNGKYEFINGGNKEIEFEGGKYYGLVNEDGKPKGFGVLTKKIKDKTETLVGTFNAGILVEGKMSSGGSTLSTLSLDSFLLSLLSPEEKLTLQKSEENQSKMIIEDKIRHWIGDGYEQYKDGRINPIDGPDGLFVRETPTSKILELYESGELKVSIPYPKNMVPDGFIGVVKENNEMKISVLNAKDDWPSGSFEKDQINGHAKIIYKIPKTVPEGTIFSLEGLFQNNALVEGTRRIQVEIKDRGGNILGLKDVIEIGQFANDVLIKGTKIYEDGTKLTSLDLNSSELKEIIQENKMVWFPFSYQDCKDGEFTNDECDGLFIRETPTTKEICLFSRGLFKGSVGYPKTLTHVDSRVVKENNEMKISVLKSEGDWPLGTFENNKLNGHAKKVYNNDKILLSEEGLFENDILIEGSKKDKTDTTRSTLNFNSFLKLILDPEEVQFLESFFGNRQLSIDTLTVFIDNHSGDIEDQKKMEKIFTKIKTVLFPFYALGTDGKFGKELNGLFIEESDTKKEILLYSLGNLQKRIPFPNRDYIEEI